MSQEYPRTPVKNDEPLVILKPHLKYSVIGLLILVCGFIVAMFGFILPVLTTGNFSTMWVMEEEIIHRILMFCFGWLMILGTPFLMMIILRTGPFYFYNNRMELHSFWTKRKIIIPYKEMHVRMLGNGVIITKQKLPSCLHPLKRFKIEYWDGIGFSANLNEKTVAEMKKGLGKVWVNPEDIPKIMKILKEKAFSYTEK